MRVCATLAYDGSHFYGFQSQTTSNNTVIGNLQNALKSIGIESNIVGAGRTDKGVHAIGQVVSFDLPPFWADLEKLKNQLNQKLKYIKIKDIVQKDPNFHARFEAKKREYIYIFKTRPLNVFERNYISAYSNFDAQKLKSILKIFEGKHDFKMFCKTDPSQKNTLCNVFSARYKRYKNYHIIKISANRFLRSQIRIMVDACMKYTTDKLSKEMIEEQLNCTKKYSETLASPSGLYLFKVYY